jgi:hypothetical protein
MPCHPISGGQPKMEGSWFRLALAKKQQPISKNNSHSEKGWRAQGVEWACLASKALNSNPYITKKRKRKKKTCSFYYM